ncbi:methylated-DNA--[protein]-cysteine S-methyltransferase [Lacticigenium naphthae]|uniref:methylated-DNA--[protein]-cysteine S-methyltransferase n=1 Tax=Lacticigenium naphthae TaxID=515351 RepID=UPI0003F9380B|nr:methylated-DNA--[protein]-cysteine S-methyltransferase [Lacticigenium naphthae]
MNNMDTPVFYATLPTPQGTLYVAATTKGLCYVSSFYETKEDLIAFIDKKIPSPLLQQSEEEMQIYLQQLQEYFEGTRQTFSLPLDLRGTAFQKSVWMGLNSAPYGKTKDYEMIAKKINHPTAIRAVSSAIGKNPLTIVLPCHRIIRKNGELGGYRGTLAMKKFLLQHETDHLDN